jgi:hypothetical protein
MSIIDQLLVAHLTENFGGPNATLEQRLSRADFCAGIRKAIEFIYGGDDAPAATRLHALAAEVLKTRAAK